MKDERTPLEHDEDLAWASSEEMTAILAELICDWCNIPMDRDETGYHCIRCNQGGHLLCGFRHNERVHE